MEEPALYVVPEKVCIPAAALANLLAAAATGLHREDPSTVCVLDPDEFRLLHGLIARTIPLQSEHVAAWMTDELAFAASGAYTPAEADDDHR